MLIDFYFLFVDLREQIYIAPSGVQKERIQVSDLI